MELNKEELEITKEAWMFYYQEVNNLSRVTTSKALQAECEKKKETLQSLIDREK